ncbi:Cytochrome monooxygenase lcsI [Penicillium macrosclerotiorum]|uniref:Cytochrome monooxygenase lcsI n=1 Tax=Penicillium macrosclerotiorum TaxID=303699 RepID=UPI002549BE3A|nr:Cytochrome monooxygenase lcsI [Penicillium macrosclerotiorum]KAJ5693370.1 Cytochrome monooxygenase lcsI [Penicillium macrosclerotiorum]
MSWISFTAIALVASLLWIIIKNLYLSPLSKFPGPKLAACTDLLNLYWTTTGQHHYKLKELHDKYGDVVRTGPTTLIWRSPQAWKDIYGHRKAGASSFLKDPKFYLLGPRGPTLLNADDATHSRGRRLLSHAFSEKALRDQESLIQSYVDLLIDRLHGEITASRATVDMTRWYNFTTFDIIGDLAFGEPFDCLRESQYHPWVKAVFVSVKVTVLRRPLAVYPFLAPVVNAMMPARLLKLREDHFALSAEKVHRRLEMDSERPDFMTHVLRFTGDRAMTTREMEANASLLILAGSETTASLLSGMTYYMLSTPDVYQKLVDEIRHSFQSYEEIDFLAVGQLAYLNAALEESLRIYPPVPATIPRIVPKGGAMIDGKFVPEGTSVSGAHYSTYHAESHFADADSFIPERWLENRDKRFEADCRGSLQAFSLGPRNCLGRNLAYAEMRLIMAKILWSFDMTLGKALADWHIQKAYNIWEKKPLMVTLSPVQR